jgi:choline monooxygenase
VKKVGRPTTHGISQLHDEYPSGTTSNNLVLPVSARETLVRFEYYYEDVSENVRPKLEEDIRTSDAIQQEDIEICEHVQRGLESKAYDKGRFSPEMELAVHHYQSLLKRELRPLLDQ